MTNEEKAQEIASKYERWNSEDDESVGAYKGALDMAQWKEQEMLNQFKEFLSEYFYEHPNTSWLICSDEFQDMDDMFERLERYLKEE